VSPDDFGRKELHVHDIAITPPDPDAGTTSFTFTDLTMIDTEDPAVVPAALAHLREAARYACGAAARNSCYPPELPVAVLADTVAAVCALARQIAPYVGDFWPHAADQIRQARSLLEQARGSLDDARHDTMLTPPAGEHEPLGDASALLVSAVTG
jgi:hypothetical protein